MKTLKNLLAIILISFVSCTPVYALSPSEFLIPSFMNIELMNFRTLTEIPAFTVAEPELVVIVEHWNFLNEETAFEEFREQINKTNKRLFRNGRSYGICIIHGPVVKTTDIGEYVYEISFWFLELGQEI